MTYFIGEGLTVESEKCLNYAVVEIDKWDRVCQMFGASDKLYDAEMLLASHQDDAGFGRSVILKRVYRIA